MSDSHKSERWVGRMQGIGGTIVALVAVGGFVLTILDRQDEPVRLQRPLVYGLDVSDGYVPIFIQIYNQERGSALGCVTMSQAVDSETAYPIEGAPRQLEFSPFTVDGGHSHDVTAKFSLPGPRSLFYYETWVECTNPEVQSSGAFFSVGPAGRVVQLPFAREVELSSINRAGLFSGSPACADDPLCLAARLPAINLRDRQA